MTGSGVNCTWPGVLLKHGVSEQHCGQRDYFSFHMGWWYSSQRNPSCCSVRKGPELSILT